MAMQRGAEIVVDCFVPKFSDVDLLRPCEIFPEVR